jgi:glycosyltransferase involved in cell wall biosynthesis
VSATPLVTIGCAVYNGAATLERALAPLVGQDYPNIELLIADDCSTDRSLEICEAVARRDPRVRVIRNARNLGRTRNLNALFREAKGEYFMWADQDDIRDRSFVRKTLAMLEADPEAVLCQSYTGAFIGDPNDVKYLATLDGVAGVRPLVARYAAFLARYSDFAIYGLMRTEALRRTNLWQNALGSANALAFELLLQGPFLQVPEPLYFYSGRGVGKRPTPQQEYDRMNMGRPMPWYYFPFLVLAANQSRGIVRSPLPVAARATLLVTLWGHVAAVAGTKLVYRVLDRLTGGHLPAALTEACSRIADPQPRLIFLDNAPRDEALFPRGYVVSGGRALRSRK